jgi:hypothetical protein
MPDTTNGQDIVEEKPQEEVTASEQTQVDELPEDVSERTREQFEKLKESNKQMKERLNALEAGQQDQLADIYDSLRPKGMPQLDENSGNLDTLIKDGYVDENVLKQSLNQLTKQAQEAQKRADLAQKKIQEIEENAQVKEAYKEYPQLNPKNTDVFDPNFYKLVKNELIGQMIEGKKDLLEAAQEVSRVYKPNVEAKEKEQAKKEDFDKKEEQIQKQNPTSGARGQDRYAELDQNDLVKATMRNQKGALAERLRRSGY